ncbi:MAG: type I-E CRISPR-associated protein Cse2/CasB [Thermodesulfobacteriota bacterium]
MGKSFAEGFIQYLKSMEADRGKLATLRKGLIDTQSQSTWPLLSRFINFDKPYQMKVLQTVAGLYAHHPQNTSSGNLGSTCFKLLDEDEKKKMAQGESGPISRNFQYVLAANGEELLPRVRRLGFRSKADEIPINYVQLTKDLLDWQYKKDRIKLAWGKEFWKVSDEAKLNELKSEANADD